jgi:hypothetical protein
MKAALWTAVFCVVAAAETGRADPKVQSATFNCQYKPLQNEDLWESRGSVLVGTEGGKLILTFVDDSSGNSSLNSVFTTNTENELLVEARCLGEVKLVNNENFKVRDFKFNVNPNNKPAIASAKGAIEFKAKGVTTVRGTNQNDLFDKQWRMTKSGLDRGEQFNAQKESQTVCGTRLSISFEDLRAIVKAEFGSDSTFVNVESFVVSFDRC